MWKRATFHPCTRMDRFINRAVTFPRVWFAAQGCLFRHSFLRKAEPRSAPIKQAINCGLSHRFAFYTVVAAIINRHIKNSNFCFFHLIHRRTRWMGKKSFANRSIKGFSCRGEHCVARINSTNLFRAINNRPYGKIINLCNKL